MKLIISFLLIFATNISQAETSFTIVNTGFAEALDILSVENGDFKKIRFNHAAFIIKHNDKTILFETGIGSQIKKEFQESMPFWARPIFKFQYIKSLKNQLPQVKYDKIFLSHVHWDHAGGLTDNLGGNPLISLEEQKELSEQHFCHHRTFPIHFKNSPPSPFKWNNSPYLEFEKHYDIFGDGKIIIVPIPGHSFGSIGLILNGNGKDKVNDKKYFFVGDAIWLEKQLNTSSHKAYIASLIVDRNKKELSKTISKIKVMRDKFNYQIIPTHDAKIHDLIGYFPQWTTLK